jgi:hypothetical protein
VSMKSEPCGAVVESMWLANPSKNQERKRCLERLSERVDTYQFGYVVPKLLLWGFPDRVGYSIDKESDSSGGPGSFSLASGQVCSISETKTNLLKLFLHCSNGGVETRRTPATWI